MEERLQKILSAAGVCSRRQAEQYLAAGRVAVNGRTAALGEKADPEGDTLTLDGVPLTGQGERRTYLLLHKPRGYVTTLSDERGRRTVAQLVADCGARVWPVGRLDLDSEGLLLMTDDGELTNGLLHPSRQVEKEYLVWVTGDVEYALPILSGPMELDGEPLAPAKVASGQSGPGPGERRGNPVVHHHLPGKKPPGTADVCSGGVGGQAAQAHPGGTGAAGPEAQAGTVAAPDRPGADRPAEALVISWKNAGKFLQDSSADLQKWLAFFSGNRYDRGWEFCRFPASFPGKLPGRPPRAGRAEQGDRQMVSSLQEGANIVRR